MLLQCLLYLNYSRCLLSYCDIYADAVLAVLVDHRIDCDRCLTGLPVSDDQLSLSPAYREHGVDREDTGLKRRVYRLTVDNRRSRRLNRHVARCLYFSEPVNRNSERINDSPEEAFAYRNACGFARTLYTRAFSYALIIIEEYASDLIGTDILYHAPYSVSKEQDLAVCGKIKAAYSRDTIPYGLDLSDLLSQSFRCPCVDRLLKERDDVSVGRRNLDKGVAQLAEPSAYGPVIDVASYLEPESARESIRLGPLHDDIFAVFIFKKFIESRLLLLMRSHLRVQHSSEFCYI